jgi:hypothetical protein
MTPGFMQVCHGKLAPINRVLPSYLLGYYAPMVFVGGKETWTRWKRRLRRSQSSSIDSRLDIFQKPQFM